MAICLLLASIPALAAPIQEPTLEQVNALGREIAARVREAESGGNLLTVVQVLRALDAEYADQGPVAQQVLALYRMERTAELGNYGEALRQADKSSPGIPSSWSGQPSPDAHEALPALEVLADLAADELIVMINEAHHAPQHRAFTYQLLGVLRELGFTHFAAETLSHGDMAALAQRGYPTRDTGAYLNEPVYADLVRHALALGFQVVAYESLGGDRELGQATNLIERVLEADPDARLVVHAGYAHINETGSIAGSRAMAGQLAEITGIDPLTIDQTTLSERGNPRFEHPLYPKLLATHPPAEPTIFVNEQGAPWSLEPEVRDVTLLHPRSNYDAARPDWLSLGGARKRVPLPKDVCGDQLRVLVEVRLTDEGEDATPRDRVEVVAEEEQPVLMLQPGKYVLEVRSVGNEVLRSEPLEVH